MNTDWSKPTKYIVGAGLALLGIYLLYLSRPVIPLLIVAALIAVIVRPAILWLHHRGRLPRGLAVALVYLSLAILGPLVLLLAFPTIVDALGYVISLDYQSIFQGVVDWLKLTLASIRAAQLPVLGFDSYIDRMVDTLLAELQQVTPTTVEPPPLAEILRSLSSVLTTTFDVAAGLLGRVVSQVALLVFMVLASIYISLNAHTYRGTLLRAAPPAYQPEIAILLARIERLWNSFFRGQLLLMFIIGVVTWLGLTALGVPGALYLGIIAGLLEVIPSLGPILAAVPGVIVALLQGSTYLQVSPLVFTLLVILFYVLVQQLENSVIVPRVLGDAVELPPLVVLIGVLVGASVGGILGALLATPVIATLRELLRYTFRKLLGEPPYVVGEEALILKARPSTDLLQPVRGWLRRLSRSRSPASPPRVSDGNPSPTPDPEAKDHPEQ